MSACHYPTFNSSPPGATCMIRVSIGSDNGLSPIRYKAVIWTNAWLLSIGPLETFFSEILTKIHNFSFMKMHLKLSSVKCRSFCPGGDELMEHIMLSGTTVSSGNHTNLTPFTGMVHVSKAIISFYDKYTKMIDTLHSRYPHSVCSLCILLVYWPVLTLSFRDISLYDYHCVSKAPMKYMDEYIMGIC